MKATTGWTNRNTWNVAFWMKNDDGTCSVMRRCADYATFVAKMYELGLTATPDGVAWDDVGIDTDALDAMMAEDRKQP